MFYKIHFSLLGLIERLPSPWLGSVTLCDTGDPTALAPAQGHAATSAPSSVLDPRSCGEGWQPQSSSQVRNGLSHLPTCSPRASRASQLVSDLAIPSSSVFTVRILRLRLFPCLPLSSYRHHAAPTKVHRRSGAGRAGPNHGWG